MSDLRQSAYNRGEWAELYVLLKLLGEGRLYAADERMRRTSSYLEVLKIIREEVQGHETEYATSPDLLTVEISINGFPAVIVPAAVFLENARVLFAHISNRDVKGRTISAPESVCDFASYIMVTKPKSKSVRAYKGDFGGKNDIIVKVRDSKNALVSTMGFSIKSSFAGAATLFNAGHKSAVIFRVKGASGQDAHVFNGLLEPGGNRNWAACSEYLRRRGLAFELLGTRDGLFAENLMFVNADMLKVLSECLLQRFVYDPSVRDVPSVVAAVARANPLKYPAHLASNLYETTVKSFLFASFTGLTAARPWNGEEQVNGGYIVVKDDGDVVCYHAYDLVQFKNYLFRSTQFEYVSCKKFNWSFMEPDGLGGWLLPINFSIRFNGLKPAKDWC